MEALLRFADGTTEKVEDISRSLLELLTPAGLPSGPRNEVKLAEDVTPAHFHELIAEIGDQAVQHAA